MEKIQKSVLKITLLVLLMSAMFFGGAPVFADTATPGDITPGGSPPDTTTGGGSPTSSGLENPLGEGITSVPQLIGNVVKAILSIVGALALLMFVFGGFTWLTSGGSADKIKKGKDILMWATIGLVVIFASYTLVDFLLRAFGL